MTPDPTPAQLADLARWLFGDDGRTREQVLADQRALGDGVHPRGLRVADRVGVGGVV